MTTRTIIFAISEYYGISTAEASEKYYNRVSEDEYDHCIEWYLEKREIEHYEEGYI